MAEIRVLFVCLGNICRSPMAEGIFRHLLARAGLDGRVQVESAGTGSWHVGEHPDPRTLDTLERRGIRLPGKRARQIRPEELSGYDYVVAMDRANLRRLRQMGAEQARLLLDFAGREGEDVPDPYYEGGFERVYELVEEGCRGLVGEVRERLG